MALLLAVYGQHNGTLEIPRGHDTFYAIKWPWLHEAREWSLFGVLLWCFVFARRDPAFVRVGLAGVILAFAILALPPKVLKQPLDLHEFQQSR